jgi:murein DD-endopeptidase MepM/ murein hydrolase activator NlpD
MKSSLLTLLLLSILACGSPRLPLPAPVQFAVSLDGNYSGDSLFFTARNTTGVPLRFQLKSIDPAYRQLVPEGNYALSPYGNKELRFGPIPEQVKPKLGPTLQMWPLLDTASIRPDTSARYRLPFPVGKSYPIMQGYQGTVSHNRPSSRYAIDFTIPIGDTICAARDGIVIELVRENTLQGADRRFEPYANYLTLYHPDGVITQYVHLQPGGVLVGIGDSVRVGQPIGIVGFTGYTTAPHLHFNVCIGLGKQRRSIPVHFENGPGEAFTKGDRVTPLPD